MESGLYAVCNFGPPTDGRAVSGPCIPLPPGIRIRRRRDCPDPQDERPLPPAPWYRPEIVTNPNQVAAGWAWAATAWSELMTSSYFLWVFTGSLRRIRSVQNGAGRRTWAGRMRILAMDNFVGRRATGWSTEVRDSRYRAPPRMRISASAGSGRLQFRIDLVF